MCLSITDLQYSRHKFCSECGKSKEEAQETCEGLRKEIKKGLREKKEIENCPGKGKWIDSLVVAWAQYKISKEDGRTTGQLNWFFPNFHLKKKRNGQWPLSIDEPLDDWPMYETNIHNGHPLVVGFSGPQYYQESFYWGRSYQRSVKKRMSKYRYLSEDSWYKMRKRLVLKYGNHGGRNYVEWSVNEKYGSYSDGPMTPVDMKTLKPAYIDYCTVCGDGVCVYHMDSSEGSVELKEEWEPRGEKEIEPTACNNSLCMEVQNYQTGDISNYSNSREWRVKPNRASKAFLEKHPIEAQGVIKLTRFLDFEARYKQKKDIIDFNKNH